MNQGARDSNQERWQSKVLETLERIEQHLHIIANKKPGNGSFTASSGELFAGLPNHLQPKTVYTPPTSK